MQFFPRPAKPHRLDRRRRPVRWLPGPKKVIFRPIYVFRHFASASHFARSCTASNPFNCFCPGLHSEAFYTGAGRRRSSLLIKAGIACTSPQQMPTFRRLINPTVYRSTAGFHHARHPAAPDNFCLGIHFNPLDRRRRQRLARTISPGYRGALTQPEVGISTPPAAGDVAERCKRKMRRAWVRQTTAGFSDPRLNSLLTWRKEPGGVHDH